MFDIGRYLRFKKLIRTSPSLGRKTRLSNRAAAFILAALIVFQMIPMTPGASAEAAPVEDNLWLYPEIMLFDSSIYDGMLLFTDTKLYAKYEFTASGGVFPVELRLPDVLKAVPGQYPVPDLPDAVVNVDYYGNITVNSALFSKEGAAAAAGDLSEPQSQGSAEPGDLSDPADPEPHECNELCDSDTGSTDPDVDSFAPVGDDVHIVPQEGGSAEPGDLSETQTDDTQYTIKLEIPVTFNAEKIPPMPDEETPWLVEIWNTKLIGGEYIGEFVTVELLQVVAEVEAFEALFELYDDFNFPAWMGDTKYGYDGAKDILNYQAGINWNDNTSGRWPKPDAFDLDLYFFIAGSGMTDPIPLTEAILESWGASPTLLATPKNPGATSAHNPVVTGSTSNQWAYTFANLPSGIRDIIGYIDICDCDIDCDDCKDGCEPDDCDCVDCETTEIPVFGEILYEIKYSFKMKDEDETKVRNGFTDTEEKTWAGYIVERDASGGYINTLIADFVIQKEWKDNNNAYGTRNALWTELSKELYLYSILLEEEKLIDKLSNSSPKVDGAQEVKVEMLSDETANIWTIRVTGMPAFDILGDPYDYFVVEGERKSTMEDKFAAILGAGLSLPHDNIRYDASYSNVGNFALVTDRSYHGGRVINRLAGDVDFSVDKEWQDEVDMMLEIANAMPAGNEDEIAKRNAAIKAAKDLRPGGILSLYRYPRVGTMSHRTSTPVGLSIDLNRDENFKIRTEDFFTKPDDPADPKLPRFDIEGQEYVYFLKEYYSDPGAGDYRGIPDYSGVLSFVPENEKGGNPTPGLIFNGGTLQNRRVASAGIEVTKSWIAAAQQNMRSDVTILVERRLLNWNYWDGCNIQGCTHDDCEKSKFHYVDLSKPNVNSDKREDAEEKIEGFRAEAMTLSLALSSLPQFDEDGREYQYRIRESRVTVDGVPVDVLDLEEELIGGYRYEFRSSPGSGIPSGGKVKLENKLVGETEVWIRKIWNGNSSPDLDAFFTIRPAGGSLVNPGDDGINIALMKEVHAGGEKTFVPGGTAPADFRITPGNSWHRVTPNVGAPIGDTWLVITGLPRYDEQGREIEYEVRENPRPTGYYNTFGFHYGEKVDEDGEQIGLIEASFTNTPSTGSGRHVSVTKEWADDGDLGCRIPVVMELYYIDGDILVDEVTLSRGNDWLGFLRLSHEPGGVGTGEDRNYNNYYVKERGAEQTVVTPGTPPTTTKIPYNVTYADGYDPTLASSWATTYSTAPIGYMRTHAHGYSVFGKAGTTDGSKINWVTGDPIDLRTDNAEPPPDYTWDAGTEYRTSYTFKNLRTGEVEITIEKDWKDDYHHEHNVPQRVHVQISRAENYKYNWAPLDLPQLHTYDVEYDDPARVDTYKGVVELQLGGVGGETWRQGGLTWKSTKVETAPGKSLVLPKYDANGVLYLYKVEEIAVYEPSPTVSGEWDRHQITSGGYKLDDGHVYSVGYDQHYVYGDHLDPKEPQPVPDQYTYFVTNQREDTVRFEVYKLWHDVARNVTVPGAPTNPAIEDPLHHMRPDIYLVLYEQYKCEEEDELTAPVEAPYVNRRWTTTEASYNAYYWRCEFDPLPRYTSEDIYEDGKLTVPAGTEIIYSVKEMMPNMDSSEYVTDYWDATTPLATPGIVTPPGITNVTTIPIRTVSTDHFKPIASVKSNADNEKDIDARVYDGGVIINRREAERNLSGRKIWHNIREDLPGGFPTIELELRKEFTYSGTYPIGTEVDGVDEVELTKGTPNFTFIKLDADKKPEPMPKYDEYGIFIRYRAFEIGDPIPGYAAPTYDDYTMTVNNIYNVNGPAVTVAFKKDWIFTPFAPPDEGLRPTATIELWRAMEDPEKPGELIEASKLKVGEKEIIYGATGYDGRQVFLPADLWRAGDVGVTPGAGIPRIECGDLETPVKKLLQIGYNGLPYVYYLEEHLDGYAFTGGGFGDNLGTSRDDGETPEDTAEFYYEATNKYDGSSSDESLSTFVRLQGTKTWVNDSENRFNTRPALTFRVYRAIEGKPETLREITSWLNTSASAWTNATDASDEWTYTFTASSTDAGITSGVIGGRSLYRYALNGEPYVYYVEESAADALRHHYEMDIGANGTKITSGGLIAIPEGSLRVKANASGSDMLADFKNTLQTEDTDVKKVWRKNTTPTPTEITPEEYALMLPDSITFKVEYHEEGIAAINPTWLDFRDKTPTLVTLTINKSEIIELLDGSSDMLVEFIDQLPKYGATVLIERQYRLIETHINGAAITSGAAAGFIVTGNTDGISVTNTVELIPLTIRKIWDDDYNRDGFRPPFVDFKIVRDDVSDREMNVRLAHNTDTKVDTDPEADEPDIYEYSWNVPAWLATGTASTYTVEELVGQDTPRGFYELDSNNNPIIPPEELGDKSFTLGESIDKDKQLYEFINMHQKIRFDLRVSKSWGTGVNLDSTIIGASIGLGTADANLNAIRPASVRVRLERNTGTTSTPIWTPMLNGTGGDGDEGRLSKSQTAIQTLNQANSWSLSPAWEDLVARHNGGSQQYRVVEINAAGDVITTMHGYNITNSSTITYTSNQPKQTINPAALTNTLKTTSLKVDKSWVGYEDNEFAKTANVTVQLMYRVQGGGAFIDATGTNSRQTFGGPGWTYTFAGLPTENNAGTPYEYTVREVAIGGENFTGSAYPYSYNKTDGVFTAVGAPTTVTNTLVPRNDITVTKMPWNDSNNQDDRRPATVYVRLIRDMDTPEEMISARVPLSATNTVPWTHTFENLPKYRQDGTTPSTYHVVEEAVQHYELPDFKENEITKKGTLITRVIGGVSTNLWLYEPDRAIEELKGVADVANAKVDITNNYTPRLMNLRVTKQWSPTADPLAAPDNTRPTAIQFRLYRTTNSGLVGNTDETNITSGAVEYLGFEDVSASSTIPWTTAASMWNNLPIMKNVGGSATVPGTSSQFYYFVKEVNTDGTLVKGHTQLYTYALDNTGGTSGGTADIRNSIRGSIADNPQRTHTVTLANTLETIDLNVTKNWVDTAGKFVLTAAQKPDVTVELYFFLGENPPTSTTQWAPMPGATEALLTATKLTDGWLGLPVKNSYGVPYHYAVKETKIGTTDLTGSNYPYSYARQSEFVLATLDTNDDTLKATLTNTLQTSSITISKDWFDNDNQDGVRPSTVTVRLIKDMGTAYEIVSDPVTLPNTTSTPWSFTWDNLPKYRPDGSPCEYRVVEMPVGVDGYTISYGSGSGLTFTNILGGVYAGNEDTLEDLYVSGIIKIDEAAGAVTVRNSYTPKTMNIAVTKDWGLDDDPLGTPFNTRPSSVQFRLYRTTNPDSVGDVSAADVEFVDGAGKNVSASTIPEAWTALWENLPIMKEGSQYYYFVKEFNADNTALSGFGQEYTYTLDNTGGTSAGTADLRKSLRGSIEDSMPRTHTVTVKNTLNTTILTVTKVWDDIVTDNPFTADLADKPAVELHLYFRLEGTTTDPVWTLVPSTIASPITLDNNNGRTGTWSSLPIENSDGSKYLYAVKEVKIGGLEVTDTFFPYSYSRGDEYVEATADGDNLKVAITNTLERRSITISKKWEDFNNQDGVRPNGVQVVLIKDMGEDFEIISEPVTLYATSTLPWTYTWNNLPKYRPDGTPSEYRVVELPAGIPSDYSLQYKINGGDEDDGEEYEGKYSTLEDLYVSDIIAAPANSVTVINSYTPKTMSITAEKHWEDQNDRFEMQPLSAQLQLYVTTNSDGVTDKEAVGTPETVDASTDWEATWNDLPIRKVVDGVSTLLRYTVEETSIHGYTADYKYNGVSPPTLTSLSGNIATPDLPQKVDVTNNLDTVDVTVNKVWEDYHNSYAVRPETLIFALQKRIDGGTWAQATDINGDIIHEMTVTSAESQGYIFTNLPKFDTNGDEWQYRVLEIAALDGTTERDFTSSNGGTAGFIGDKQRTHYEYSTEVLGYETTITNELVVETISISGTKYWIDHNNAYGLRPDDVEFKVYYRDAETDDWAPVDESLYTLEWTNKNGKDAQGNDFWTYEITGPGLTKFVPNKLPLTLRQYCIQEIAPPFYGVVVDSPKPSGDAPANSSIGERRSAPDHHIYDADFENWLPYEITSLWVYKDSDWLPKADSKFIFEVYLSDKPIDEDNPGTLYKGHVYHVFGGKFEDYDKLTDEDKKDAFTEKMTDDGLIEIGRKQSFMLVLPQGVYFNVVEVDEFNDFEIDKQKTFGTSGRTNPTDEPSLTEIYNVLLREVSIINITDNEGQSPTNPGNLTNAGGLVRVELGFGQMQWDDDVEKRDALSVVWEPDEEFFWVLGDFFIIEYLDFGSTDWNTVVVNNYLDDDGELKALEDCDADYPDLLQRFLDAGAKLEFTTDGSVRLVLSEEVEDMPRAVNIYVQFLPTIAVNNVTEGNQGGQVVVSCDSTGGNMNNNADGVPDLGGKPYKKAKKVYGKPDEGWKVDWSYIVIRNLNDLDGEYGYAMVEVGEDGYFETTLNTKIAGKDEVVVKKGWVTEGSIWVEIEELPVSLQIDLRFIPDDSDDPGDPGDSGDSGDSGDTKDPDDPDDPGGSTDPDDPDDPDGPKDPDGSKGTDDKGGTLPKTGLVSIIETLVIGLITSLAATATVALVIRRQRAKYK
ncbi:MAG: Cna B-type domain-containing protein [Oscillospiraceae bacterium]|nr:Cna B-type domain-containing protein [Oscillospiraceae bacterium]